MMSCRGEATLRLLGSDAISEETYIAIEAHVEGCSHCKAVLERLAHRRGDDPPVALTGPAHWPRIPGFEIHSELDRGAMGVVYLAIETGLERLVALKILPGALGPEASQSPRRRWLREARAISRVRHPHIVPLYDFGEADEWFFLVLEYVPGGSLKRRMTEPLPPRAAAGLMETIARAVEFIHRRGLLHLDLKPSNILLDGGENEPWEKLTPRIADFGLALSNDGASSDETSLAGIRGTPNYMAPEQASAARGAGVGAVADIHALGAILYELLTGRPPFQGTSTIETLDQVRGQNPVPPRRLNPKIPRDLETIALKCLEKNPSRRYASAEALAGDLRRWLDGRAILARPVSWVEHATRWCCRQPVVATLAATLFVTLLGGVLGLLALLRQSEILRLHSDADYQVASRSLDEILNLFRDSIHNSRIFSPHFHHPRELWEALQITRSQEVELSKRHPMDVFCLKRISEIDECLSTYCLENSKRDDARSLMEDAITCLDACLALDPEDSEARLRRLLQITNMLELFSEDNDVLYECWNAKAIAALQQFNSDRELRVRQLALIARCCRLHADNLILRGEPDRARRELEQNLRMIRSERGAEFAFPVICLSEALTRARLGENFDDSLPHQPLVLTDRTTGWIEGLERSLAELAGCRIGWVPSLGTSSSVIANDPPGEPWADRVIEAMRSDSANFGRDTSRVPVIAFWLGDHCAGRSSRYRRADKLADAQRCVNQLLVLAKRLTQAYPDEATAFMLLSEAFVQNAKIAYRQQDGDPVNWERQALDAAIHAASLASAPETVHGLVKDRRARVSRLAAQ